MSKKKLPRTQFKNLFSMFLFAVFLLTAATANARQQKPPKGISELSAKLVNIESATNEPFRFSLTLRNGASSRQLYEFKADLPAGWQMTSRVDGSPVTSLSVEAEQSREISLEFTAPGNATVRKYIIPFKAVSTAQTLSVELEAVVKGSYAAVLGTPSGRLSEELTSGSHKDIELEVRNTGTLPVKDLEITSQLPSGWEASFEPTKVEKLEGGKTARVKVLLKVPDKTIAGDYAATFNLSGGNVSSQAAFRIFVKTSLLSGWIGILVILIAVGCVYALIRKYGRR